MSVFAGEGGRIELAIVAWQGRAARDAGRARDDAWIASLYVLVRERAQVCAWCWSFS